MQINIFDIMHQFSLPDNLATEKFPAILHDKGPLMIIAGPGSGKTKVIVWHVAKLLLKDEVPPDEIWVTTFTEKAAKQLRYEIANIIKNFDENNEISGMLIGTIHSTCLELMKEYREYFPSLKFPVRILDENRQLLYLLSNWKSLGLDHVCNVPGKRPSLSDLVDVMSHFNWLSEHEVDCKRYLKTIKEMLSENNTSVKEWDYWMARAYRRYLKLLEKDGYLDFPRILREVAYAIENKELTKEIGKRIKHVVIDEYQDVNPLQMFILNEVAKASGENNIVVVGDDDQAIYQFRGASIGSLRDFDDEFSPLRKDLETNFRSSSYVVQASSDMISKNAPAVRFSKELKTNNERSKEDLPLLKIHGESLPEAAELLAKQLNILIKENKIRGYGDITILLRSVKKNHVENYEKALEQMKIPYITIGRAGVFSTPIGLSFLHFFDFLSSPTNEVDDYFIESELLNLEKETIYTIKSNFNRITLKGLEKIESEKDIRFLRTLLELKESIKPNDILSPIYSILKERDYLNELNSRRDNDTIAIVSQITKIALEYQSNAYSPSLHNFSNYIRELWECELIEIPEDHLLKANKVKIMTAHQAKGLEFPVVVIGEAINGRFPAIDRPGKFFKPRNCLKRPIMNEYFEDEEKRLFYVAMTRARDLLIINTANKVNRGSRINKGPTTWLENINSSCYNTLLEISKSIKNPLGTDYIYKEEMDIFSYSKLKYYEFCPYRYFMIFEMGLAFPIKNYFIIGENAHAALALIHRKAMKGENINEKDISEIVKLSWEDIRASRKENEIMKNVIIKEISTYVKKNKSSFHNILWTEKEFWLHYPEGIFTGRIDLFRHIGGENEIIDFKTGEIDEIDTLEQLYVYTYGCKKAYKLDIDKMSMYKLKMDEKHPEGGYFQFVPNSNKLNTIENKIRKTIKNINLKKFEPLPDNEKCKECELYEWSLCPFISKIN